MEEHRNSELDPEKKLADAPLEERGFSDQLRRQIEARLDERTTKRTVKRWVAALCGVACAFSAFFLLSASRTFPVQQQSSAAQPSPAPPSSELQSGTQLSAAPIRSALLIGFRLDHEVKDEKHALALTKASTYRTMLIAPDSSGKLKVAAEGPGILMPYRQWFWKIEALNWETDTDNIHYLVARQADQSVKPELFPDIPTEELKHTEKLLFAGNQYISIAETENIWSPESSAEYNRISVKKITQLGSNRVINFTSNKKDPNRVTLQDVYGSEAGDRLAVMLSDAKKTSRLSELNGDSWTIRRRPGRWTAVAAETYTKTRNRSEGYELREFQLPLPELATSYDKLSLKWSDILKVQPKVKDALTSPQEDIAAVFAGDWLYLYPYQQPLPDGALLSVALQPGETMVMAQWATGSYVEDWTRKAKLYLARDTGSGSSQ